MPASGGRRGCRRCGLHRADVVDRQLGVDLPDDLLQRQPERFRRQAGADDHEEAVVGTVGVGIIDGALGVVVGEPRLFHGADDADDGECLGIAGPLRDPGTDVGRERWRCGQ